jgi:hypothetical protein
MYLLYRFTGKNQDSRGKGLCDPANFRDKTPQSSGKLLTGRYTETIIRGEKEYVCPIPV